MTSAITNSTREKLLELLGDNVDPKAAAAALGISESMVSQYISDENFAAEVSARRYKTLVGHNSRDRKADELEDKLLDRIERSLNMVFDPMKLAALYRTVNGATRRGASAPAQLQESKPAVPLILPTFVFQKFTTQVNLNNQVIAVSDESGKQESLVTIQSRQLAKLVEERNVSDATPSPETPARITQTGAANQG